MFVRSESGLAGVVLLALAFPLVLLFLGLGLDYGRGFVLRHELQAACDAAALAGASQVIHVFETDQWGIPQPPTEGKIVLDEQRARAEAEKVFERNVEAKGLLEGGVKIVKKDFYPVDAEECRFAASVRAEILTFFSGPAAAAALGGRDFKTISVARFAEAKAVLED